MVDMPDELALEMIIRGWDIIYRKKFGPFLMNAVAFGNQCASNMRSGGFQNFDIPRTHKQYFLGVSSLNGIT
eukprot:UN04826